MAAIRANSRGDRIDLRMRVPEALHPVSCARCGTVFDCMPGGNCWCAAEPVRLPMPASGSLAGCLCRSCLRLASAADFRHQPAPRLIALPGLAEPAKARAVGPLRPFIERS